MWSEFVKHKTGAAGKIQKVENEHFKSAHRIVVTTNEMMQNI